MEQQTGPSMPSPYQKPAQIHPQSAALTEPQIAPLSTRSITNTTITQQTSGNLPRQNRFAPLNPLKLRPIRQNNFGPETPSTLPSLRTLLPNQFHQEPQPGPYATSTIPPTSYWDAHNHFKASQPRPMRQPTAATTMPVTTQTQENSRTSNPHRFFPSTVTPSHTSTPQEYPYNLINKRKAPSDPHNNQEPKSKRPRFQ